MFGCLRGGPRVVDAPKLKRHGAPGYNVDSGGTLFTKIRGWGDRLFPEFQILFRRSGRVAYLHLTSVRQAGLVGALVVSAALIAYLGARYQHFDRVVVSRDVELARADHDKQALQQQIAQLKSALNDAKSALGSAEGRVAAAVQEKTAALQEKIEAAKEKEQLGGTLADTQQRLAALEAERVRVLGDRKEIERKLAASEDKLNGKMATLAQVNAQLSKALESDRDELRHSDSKQATLQSRLTLLEKELEKANQHTGQYKSDIANIDRKLQSIAVERDEVTGAKTAVIVPTAVSAPTAVASSNAAPAAGSPKMIAAEANVEPVTKPEPVAKAVAPAAPGKSSELERLIASTGIDISRLMKDLGTSPRGEGGPFVALADAPRAASDGERQKILQKLMSTLPLKAPLDEYRLESPFGPRIDPINHRKAFHSGLDLSAAYRTHVYSTAPGTVIYAGSEDAYGRVVEIDHGHGIVTRYAHLHRSFVVKGQKVTAHYAIGELGSTGRSTGPHVHYEIVVDGVPQDPAKFIGVGKNVVQVGTN